MKFSKNLRHSLNCGNSSLDLRYRVNRDPQTLRSFLRSLLDFLNENFIRRVNITTNHSRLKKINQ